MDPLINKRVKLMLFVAAYLDQSSLDSSEVRVESLSHLAGVEILLDHIWKPMIDPIAPSCGIEDVLISENRNKLKVKLLLLHQPVNVAETKDIAILDVLLLNEV